MKRIISSVILTVASLGCSGHGGEVAALVAVGSVLSVSQMAQSNGQLRQPGTTLECEIFCGPCEVPCADQCLPHGTLCHLAPGTACYGGNPGGPEYNPYALDDSNCNNPHFTIPLAVEQ